MRDTSEETQQELPPSRQLGERTHGFRYSSGLAIELNSLTIWGAFIRLAAR
jgi:hypothetical protein